MEYKIVSAEGKHLSQLEELEKQCFSVPWTGEQLKSQLRDKNHEFIVAESNEGEVLGYVGLIYALDEGDISNVAVKPQYRCEHLGTALISELMKIAENLGIVSISLEVRETNIPAQKLYSNFGFEPVGLRKNYYDFPKENAIIMTKIMK